MSLSIAETLLTGTSGDDVIVLGLSGDVDLSTIPRLSDALSRVIARTHRVVIDLDGITVLDDVALGVILGASARLSSRGGQLFVVVTDQRIRSHVVSTRLDEIIPVESSLDSIVRATP